jgi:hypothetical protein
LATITRRTSGINNRTITQVFPVASRTTSSLRLSALPESDNSLMLKLGATSMFDLPIFEYRDLSKGPMHVETYDLHLCSP